MRLAWVLAAAAALGGCSSTSYVETDSEIRITSGLGGLVHEKNLQYIEFSEKGKRIVIDGQVISADAFYAFGTPGACYTENAVFSPHAASYLGVVPARSATLSLAHRLPEPLREWYKNDISYYDWIGFAEIGYDRLLKIWPDGACPTRRGSVQTMTMHDRAGPARSD